MQCSNIISLSTIHPRKLKVWDLHSELSVGPSQIHTQRQSNFEDYDVKLPLPSHVNSITSTSNPFVKHCHKLRQSSSYRHCHGSALVVGATPIRFHLYPSLFHLNLCGFFAIISLLAQNSDGYMLFFLSCLIAEKLEKDEKDKIPMLKSLFIAYGTGGKV